MDYETCLLPKMFPLWKTLTDIFINTSTVLTVPDYNKHEMMAHGFLFTFYCYVDIHMSVFCYSLADILQT